LKERAMSENKSGEDKPTAQQKDKKPKATPKKAAPGKTSAPAKKPASKKPSADTTAPNKPKQASKDNKTQPPEDMSANDNASSSSKLSDGFQSVKDSFEDGIDKIKDTFDSDTLKEAYQKNIGEKFDNIASSEKISEKYEKAKTEAQDINWITDIKLAFRFFTRLPLPHDDKEPPMHGRALWAAPLVGVVVGALSGLVFMLCTFLGLPDILSATLAITAMVLITGCFHEDAIADVADGFGGGWSKEQKLEIMKDSRIGTYGATALFLTLIIKIGAIASLSAHAASSIAVVLLLMASGAASRAAGVALLALLAPAKDTGRAREAGTPPLVALVIALAIGGIVSLLCLAFGFGFSAMLAGIAGAIIGGSFVGWLANRQIGGSTGDVAGTCQQVAEMGMFTAALIALGV
jgi:adenosylcobinamide-GDP ribazoletransferase